jgi:hypothetical protein
MFDEEQHLSDLKRTAQGYSGHKEGFAVFCSVMRAFLQRHADLGVAIESGTDRSIRLLYLDSPLEISLSIVANPQQLRTRSR